MTKAVKLAAEWSAVAYRHKARAAPHAYSGGSFRHVYVGG